MNYIIDILNWILGAIIIPILPSEISYLPLLDFQNYLLDIRGVIYENFGFLHNFVSLRLLFGFIISVIFFLGIFFAFKSGKWFVQLIRGSG